MRRKGGGGGGGAVEGSEWTGVTISIYWCTGSFFPKSTDTIHSIYYQQAKQGFPRYTCSFMVTKWCEASICVQHFVVWLGRQLSASAGFDY